MRLSDVNPLSDLLHMGPADRGHEVGVRVAITAVAPLLLVFFLDRMDLALYVTFGSMAGIYGRGQQHGPRLRSQLRAGVLMLVVLAAATVAGQMGVSETADPWGLVWTTSLVSGFCALMCGLWSLRPGGSLFHIFAFAAVASVPFKPAPLEGMLTALAVVVFIYFVACGVRTHGPIGYLKSLAPEGVMFPLNVLVWLIEVISTILRPITLAIRLFCNMFAGHIVMGSFAIMVTLFAQPLLEQVTASNVLAALPGVLFAFILLVIYAIEIFVAFVQAYVFTILTAVYIQEAEETEEE